MIIIEWPYLNITAGQTEIFVGRRLIIRGLWPAEWKVPSCDEANDETTKLYHKLNAYQLNIRGCIEKFPD
jgi:hypothetical protein